MLRGFSRIENVGQFESFNSNTVLEKNTAIFGFNGAGKSTLSDILYSLAYEGKDGEVLRRRTLNKEGEEGEKEIHIEIDSDSEKYIFAESKWQTKPNNIAVFNGQYVSDYVFVSKELKEDDVLTVGLGKEGASLQKKREKLIVENKELLIKVNEIIERFIRADLKIKDFSSSKVTEKQAVRRLQRIEDFELYGVDEEESIRAKIEANHRYSHEQEAMEKCQRKYEQLSGLNQISLSVLKKTVSRIPRISSKEIAAFLAQTMTSTDVSWAIKGYHYQKNAEVCPMCGQTICDKHAREFFGKLRKYAQQKRDESVRSYVDSLNELAVHLIDCRVSERADEFKTIVSEMTECELLHKREIEQLDLGFIWVDEDTDNINNIITKLRDKANKPYSKVSLTEDEEKSTQKLNVLARKIRMLAAILGNASTRLDKRINKSISLEERKKLFEISYGASGAYREEVKLVKQYASKYCNNSKAIEVLSKGISDCYNQERLDGVNEFLQGLNTHLRLEVRNNEYYIKLKEYKAKKYEGSRETIFSEGENRAIALAYFLSELSEKRNCTDGLVVVIDDPISSMDLCRKSVVAYRVAELMNDLEMQVILTTHDISFLERVQSYLDSNTDCLLLELRSGKNEFVDMHVSDYLIDDETVYHNLIMNATCNDSEIDRIIALMSMRPYAYVKKVAIDSYHLIEEASTYYAHTVYSRNKNIKFKQENYSNEKIREYVSLVKDCTGAGFDTDAIAGDYSFTGFTFEKLKELYLSLPLIDMENMRKKMLLIRPLIEACFFELCSKGSFDPFHIGNEYKKIIRAHSSDKEKKNICLILKELYDATKKYHHGAEDGSFLGISWVNPNEVEFFDLKMQSVLESIQVVRPYQESA